jgi:hypothetical protein
MKAVRSAALALFLALEAVLYYLILTAGGSVLVYASFFAIVLCFLYALLPPGKPNLWMLAGLACTVGADYCLVLCQPIQRLWGMVFFLGAQSLYAAKLHLSKPSKALLVIRLGLTAVALAAVFVVLGDKADALAVVSLCYYANLIMNILVSCAQFRKYKLLPVAFVLFLLCDTVVGLQVASTGYLPIPEGSLLHRILFSGFNLAWFFYLPSQVLLSISSKKAAQ